MNYRIEINKRMVSRRSDKTFNECMEVEMTPVQKEVFLIIDEWWKRYGFSPSLRDIAHQRGKMSMSNTSKIIKRLVNIGVIKKVDRQGRTIRPVYINFRNLE
jgi:SOS-response transcriptional repressor LexA